MATKGEAAAYPSAARISDSPCYLQYSASLKCLEEFGSDKSKCQDHFDVYKECKKKEALVFPTSLLRLPMCSFVSQREARLERNKTRSLFS
ncbi:hypothetical protein ARALYDRAFT_470051 [Arabidopsis lyrata subsp. lyrata]|uniref:CHCH domain-containing protein n=1 Tax=Arabidopsis lyrata subsp. lyrata TaxID=81972 RepID=D7KP28_ARALL|nr:hypothetical protein ARALYDRAFT_470051 [Arabidopsis lyrata subsp. lyrata]